jgi:hypothetical protein
MTTMNAMNLHNVHKVHDGSAASTFESYVVHPSIAEVIWELANKYPLWQFHATHGIRGNLRTEFNYTSFDVKLNGKTMGKIFRYRNNRYEEEIGVECKRIADKMERKSAYTTKDPKKAIAKVRKEFAPKTTSETVSEAMQSANDAAYAVQRNTDYEKRKAYSVIHGAVIDFFTTGPGREIFKSYLHAERPEDAKVLMAMQREEELSLELLTISSVKDKIGKEGTALVVVDEGKYVVKILDELRMYSDTTLPENLRGKLGLLKLVQSNQFVPSAGFRVSDEVFVIDLTA